VGDRKRVKAIDRSTPQAGHRMGLTENTPTALLALNSLDLRPNSAVTVKDTEVGLVGSDQNVAVLAPSGSWVLSGFEEDIEVHAAIASTLSPDGPYKLSLHSGSDKFSIYPAFVRQTRGFAHLKTAGTSYLEALRTVATLDPGLFREVYAFARRCYEEDRASYHVSAEIGRSPLPGDLGEADLPALLEQFDAREILHVTFESVLKEARFRDRLFGLLQEHPEHYAAGLERHFLRHLKPFANGGTT
jgi:hypothetical protein